MVSVLVCTPFGPHPHRIHPLTQQCIDALGCAAVSIELPADHSMNRLDALAWKHNRAAELAINGGYDAMLHVDADMVIPPDAINRLCAVPADVAYGLYVSRRDPWRWLCFVDRGMTTTVDKQAHGHVVSYGAGMGCTLIHRHVLERIAFRTDGHTASDWWFAVDCANYEFAQMHDLGCVCGHIRDDGIAWPDSTAPAGYRIESL